METVKLILIFPTELSFDIFYFLISKICTFQNFNFHSIADCLSFPINFNFTENQAGDSKYFAIYLLYTNY